MRTASIVSLALAALPAFSVAEDLEARDGKPWANSKKIQKLIKIDGLMAGAQKLQDFADAGDKSRAFGSKAHNDTVDFVVKSLQKLKYFDVVKQPVTLLYSTASVTLSVDGKPVEANAMTYTPGGKFPDTPFVKVNNLGCDAADFPAEVKGNLAFISRGTCPFAQKVINAKAAGAAGAVIYNNVPGPLSGTLGDPAGSFIPVAGISQESSVPILAALQAGKVAGTLDVDAVTEQRLTYNVIAETKGGDHNNVLMVGSHSDSVPPGPGINDNGSGSIGILEVAKALSKFRVKNAIRFAWWTAEEFGLLGSYHYMKSINSSETEIAKIRAYLNFDMIASPNYMYGIYDGDGSAFNLTGPPGSAQLEANLEKFFKRSKKPFVPTEFSGRSDYAAFIQNGIPSGGLFTGAEVLKTEEQAKLFGGQAGVAYDANYHKAGDTVENLNKEAFLVNSKSIADAVATYAMSWDSIEPVDLKTRRWAADRAQLFQRDESHKHDGGPCGGGDEVLI